MAEALDPDLVVALETALGADRVRVDADDLASVNTDWTGRFPGAADVLVRPADVAGVAAVVRICRQRRRPLVPVGGNTGLVGGTAAPPGAVALRTDGMDAVTDMDGERGQLTAGAGSTLAQVQSAARRAGWRYPIDFAARDSATVGGMVATNAGGVHVVRHGSTRRRVLGIEAVLGSGIVVRRLAGLVKDNTGYDLAGLLCGSEGTLGVVTAARLALAPEPGGRVTAMVGFVDVADALHAGRELVRTVAEVEVVELMLAGGVERARAHLGLPPAPVDGAAVLLVEAVGPSGGADRLEPAVMELPGVTDTAVATEARDRDRLWRYRDGHTEAIAALGPPAKLDVTLPAPQIEPFLARVGDTVRAVAPDSTLWVFGHVGDGNLHVNVTGAEPGGSDVDGAVLRLVIDHGGAISAEHGIGRARRDWLTEDRDPGDVEAFRAIKAACDPDGIMNPGALLRPRRPGPGARPSGRRGGRS